MATKLVNKAVFTAFSLVFIIRLASTQSYSIDKVTVDDCRSRGNGNRRTNAFYLDISQLECKECAQTKDFQTTRDDGYGCKCVNGFRLVSDFGGGAIECRACGSNEVTSEDPWTCVSCGSGTAIDDETSTCTECSTDTPRVVVERQLDGSWSNDRVRRNCESCDSETAPTVDGDRCERCSQVLSVRPTQSNCICPADLLSGGVCFRNVDDYDPNGAIPVYDINYSGNKVIQSEWLTDNMLAAYGMCRSDYKNSTACQVLASMCAMNMYHRGLEDSTANTDACALYIDIFIREPYLPELYVADTEDALTDNGITTVFQFPETTMKFKAAMYSYNGTYLGMQSLHNGLFQFCKNVEQYMNAAYIFGTSYSQTCQMSARELYDMETIFYDVYLEFKDRGDSKLYRVPVRVLNYKNGGTNVNEDDDRSTWELVYRMYLVDNELGRPYVDSADDERPPRAERARYAKQITFEIELQESKNGKIYAPFITIDYAELADSDYDDDKYVTVAFDVNYIMDITQFNADLGAAVGVLSALAIIYSIIQSWGWSKRQGQAAIDCFTLLKFILFVLNNLSNAFFVCAFGAAFYYWIFFKNQQTVVLMLPSPEQESFLIACVGVAFALKLVQVLHLIIQQCTVDIFFIDWERPRGKIVASNDVEQKGEEAPISIWRTYFAANEYNEIQSCRKFNHVFQKFVVVLFLSVIGFENIATRDPNSNFTVPEDDYTAEHSRTLRFAIGTLAYILISVCQWIFHVFLYERFIEDKVRQYVDLCSMSNVSVFIFENQHFGYYIHGRSVHGRADTGMAEMAENMKREEEDLCGQRGLLPNTEQQTFEVAMPPKLRSKYDQVLLPILMPSPGALAGMKKDQKEIGGHLDAHTAKCIQGYAIVNRFFQAFIDHSLKNIDYYVKDKMIFESILGVEFETVQDKGLFYNDNGHGFDQVLFYGHEGTLTLFDILLFGIVDIIFSDFILAAVVTYFVDEILAAMRDGLGRRNLAKKTLVDKRFLI